MKAFLFFTMSLFGASLCALAQIERPQVGVMLDEGGEVRAVQGVAGSVTTSEPLWKHVLALACSSRACAAKTPDALWSSSGERVDAPAGGALLAIDGAAIYAYFPETQQLMRWQDGQLAPVEFAPRGDVIDLRAAGGVLESAVRRADGVWSGSRFLGDAAAVLLLEGGSVVVATESEVRLLRPDGSEKDFPVAGVRALIRMNDGCVQLVTPGGSWALLTAAGEEQIFLLPGGSQE